MGVVIAPSVLRGQVYLVALDPVRGSEIRKTRPCIVLSPDDLNGALDTVIVAPLTTVSRPWPFRVACRFAGRQGQVALDQLRTIDRARLVRHLGRVAPGTLARSLAILQEMFAP